MTLRALAASALASQQLLTKATLVAVLDRFFRRRADASLVPVGSYRALRDDSAPLFLPDLMLAAPGRLSVTDLRATFCAAPLLGGGPAGRSVAFELMSARPRRTDARARCQVTYRLCAAAAPAAVQRIEQRLSEFVSVPPNLSDRGADDAERHHG